MCVCEREKEREGMNVRERECVCVHAHERGRDFHNAVLIERVYELVSLWVCGATNKCVCERVLAGLNCKK